MSLASAFTTLNALTISGMTNLGSTLDQPPQEFQIPALFVLFDDAPGGFEDISFTDSYGLVTVGFKHHLCLGTTNFFNSTVRGTVPGLIDNYLASMRNNLMMGDNLAEALQIARIEFGVQEYYGEIFQSVMFHHLWKLPF